MKQCFILLLLSIANLVAQAQDFFPLVPGSQWVYRQTDGVGGASQLTIRLGEPSTIGGRTYHRLQGYRANDTLIRRTEGGNFVFWDESKKAEADFLLFDGASFSSNVAPCGQTGRADLAADAYKGPIGYFEGARTIRYSPGMCADAGLTSETFVPNLGLVRRAQTSFTGERSVELVYAQIGGITYLSEAGVSFSIAVTPLGRELAVRLTLINRTDLPLPLRFDSTQSYDFAIRNEKGAEVYRWSASRLFAQVTRQLSVTGEELWQDRFAIGSLPAGSYSVEGMLANSDGKKFSATASFNLP